MNWRYKAYIQNIISSLPLSDRLYYLRQRTAGSPRPGPTNPLEWLQAAAQLSDWIEAAKQIFSWNSSRSAPGFGARRFTGTCGRSL